MSEQFPKNANKLVNDQMVIRALCPRDTVKWLAKLMGISLHAARVWVERTVPVYRREEFGRRLLEEYHRQNKEREQELLPAILHMAGLVHEVHGAVPDATIAGTAANLMFAAQRRVEAEIDRLEAEQSKEVNGRLCHRCSVWW